MENKIRYGKAVQSALMVVLTVCLWTCGSPGEFRDSKVKILVIHSYHIDYLWTRSIDDGIMDVLGDQGFIVKRVFMDTKRNTGEDFKRNAGKQALAEVETFKPRVVIATDDNAQEYVGQYLAGRDGLSLVFCGVNSDPGRYNYPAANVTGVLERPFIRGALNLLEKIKPGIRTFTVLTDHSPTSLGFVHYLNQLKLDAAIVKIVETNDWNRWQQEVKAVTSEAVITYMYHTVKQNGVVLEPHKVMEWTVSNLDKPTLGFFDFAVSDGVLLGYVESAFEHGELAAKMAVEILEGKTAGEIPISTARKWLIAINKTTADALGVDISPLMNIADKVEK